MALLSPVAVMARPTERIRARFFQRRVVALGGIIALYCAVRCSLLARGLPTPDSDEATIGLMAMHILHGEAPIFFWGQTYMGSMEAYLMAPFFGIFGPSVFLLHCIPMLMGAGALVAIYALGARIASPRVGLLSALLLAVGPPFFVVLGVRAYGGYIDTLLWGSVLLWLALRGGTLAPQAKRRNAFWIGLVGGIALWTNVLAAPFFLAAALIAIWQRRADLVRRNAAALGGGVTLGAAPAILYNIMHQGATVATILGYTVVSGGQAGQPGLLATIWQNLERVVTVTLPILGGGPGGLQGAGMTSAEHLALAQRDPLGLAVGAAAAALALMLGLSAAWRVIRTRRDLWVAPGAAPEPGQIAQQGQAALLLVAGISLLAPLLGRQDVFAMPRYFFPVYIAVPALVAEGGRWLAWIFPPRRFAQTRWLVAGGLVVAMLCWNGARLTLITSAQTAARDHGAWIAGDDAQVIQRLNAAQVKTVISNDYWVGLRLTFEAKESFAVIMVKPRGVVGFNRYAPYVTAGLRDPRPAYLELTGTEEAQIDHANLSAGRMPGYTEAQIGAYTVFIPGM